MTTTQPLSSLIASYQQQIAQTTDDQRAAIVDEAKANLSAIYYAAEARADDTTMTLAGSAYHQIEALAAHADQAHAMAAGATAAAQSIAAEHAALTTEHAALLDDLERIDIDNPKVQAVHRDGFHTGIVAGVEEGFERALEAADVLIASSYHPLMRQHVPVHQYAAEAFLKLVWDQDYLIDDLPQEMKNELADFINSWTRRVLVDLYIDPPVPIAEAAMNDLAWWDRGYTIDEFLFGGYPTEDDE